MVLGTLVIMSGVGPRGDRFKAARPAAQPLEQVPVSTGVS
jgi:hypothetical protein